jgi:hypothetical protein
MLRDTRKLPAAMPVSFVACRVIVAIITFALAKNRKENKKLNEEEARELAKRIETDYPKLRIYVQRGAESPGEVRWIIGVWTGKSDGEELGDMGEIAFTIDSQYEWEHFEKGFKVLSQGQVLERWQMIELARLLASDYKPALGKYEELSETRAYLESGYYGEKRYHVISFDSYMKDITIDQTDHGEKYQQRIVIETQEIEAFTRQLLVWHLRKAQQEMEILTNTKPDESLGDLDDLF